MGDPNPFISNGTCYGSSEFLLASAFLPCGNAAFGHKQCCQAGDMCLSSDACYNGRYGITYIAVCTDPEYTDESCPPKHQLANLAWVGLVYCNETSNEWSECDQKANPSTLTTADFCYCPQTSRTLAFSDNSVLTNIVSLPTALGQSVVWQAGFVPTVTQLVSAQPSSTSSPSQSSSASSSSILSAIASLTGSEATPTASSQSSQGFSDGKKLAVGLGVGLGGLLLILCALLLFSWYRKRKIRDGEKDVPFAPVPPTPTTPGTLGSPSELGEETARHLSVQSELDGSEVRRIITGTDRVLSHEYKGGLPSVAELPGSLPESHR